MLPARPIRYFVAMVHEAWRVSNMSATNISNPNWPYLNFTISLTRQASFALHMYVAPPVVITMLIPFAFLLKTAGVQRCILGELTS